MSFSSSQRSYAAVVAGVKASESAIPRSDAVEARVDMPSGQAKPKPPPTKVAPKTRSVKKSKANAPDTVHVAVPAAEVSTPVKAPQKAPNKT